MRFSVFLGAFLVMASCDDSSPPEIPMSDRTSKLTPDPNFRLDPAERIRLDVLFDPDALEQWMALYQKPADRDQTLEQFLELADMVARGEATIDGVGKVEGGHSEVDEEVVERADQLFKSAWREPISGTGNDPLERMAATWRNGAAAAISVAFTGDGDPDKIATAQSFLAEGDGLGASGALEDAVDKYKEAYFTAEDAKGR